MRIFSQRDEMARIGVEFALHVGDLAAAFPVGRGVQPLLQGGEVVFDVRHDRGIAVWRISRRCAGVEVLLGALRVRQVDGEGLGDRRGGLESRGVGAEMLLLCAAPDR